MGSDGYVGGYISSQYHLDTYAQKTLAFSVVPSLIIA